MPLSIEDYAVLSKYLPKEVLSRFGAPTYPKFPTSVSISAQAKLNLTKAMNAFKYSSLSALMEAIGTGLLWLTLPTAEEIQDRKDNPKNYPYQIELPDMPE